MTERARIERPSQAVMIDVGLGHGALIISADPGMLGDELEISHVDSPLLRQHVFVLMRSLPRETAYAAVFPRLRAGEYLLWGSSGDEVVARVRVAEGQVANTRWPSDLTQEIETTADCGAINPQPISVSQGV